MKDYWTNHFRLISVDIPTTMEPLDRNTGENIAEAFRQQERRLPGLPCFQEQFGFNVKMAIADRAGGNIRAESHFKFTNPKQTTLEFPCDVHKKATYLKGALNVVQSVISGVVNVGLSLEGIGSLATLRDILQSVFREKLEVVFDNPPGGAIAKHRLAVLDLVCAPPHRNKTPELAAKTKKRRLILNYFCNSDLEKDEIVHYCPFACCSSPETTLAYFLEYVTWALLPRKMGVLSRKSWVGMDAQFDWLCTLSAFWNLHRHVIIKYTGSPSRILPTSTATDSSDSTFMIALGLQRDGDQTIDLEEIKGWKDLLSGKPAAAAESKHDCQLEPEETDPDGPPGTATAGAGNLEGSQMTWAEFNRSCKRKASAFLESAHYWQQVILTRIGMQPGLRLIYSALYLASKDFEQDQDNRIAQGNSREYRVEEAARGTTVDECFAEVEGLLVDPPPALPISLYTRYSRSLLFRILSAQACSVERLVRRSHRSFPYQCFALLDKDNDKARNVYSLPDCMWEDFAKSFFQKYPTYQDSQSPSAQAILHALSVVGECDIASVECGHSSVREWTRLRGRGHTPSLVQVAARCLCRWIRARYVSEGEANQPAREEGDQDQDPESESQKKKKKRSGGGGAYRAFISDKAKDRRLTKEDFIQLAIDYRELEHDEWQEYYEMGVLATLVHRAGEKPFRSSSSSKNNSDSNNALAAWL